MSIDCAFYGFLARDADARTSQVGKLWVRLSIGVGKDDALQWVSCAVFGKAAETAAQLVKGDRVYVEGSIKLESWSGSDGAERHSLNVAAFKCERTHQIGRNRPKREDQPSREQPKRQAAPAASAGGAAFDDEIPFAPEQR
jgi:single-stranded DNA-binding protein